MKTRTSIFFATCAVSLGVAIGCGDESGGDDGSGDSSSAGGANSANGSAVGSTSSSASGGLASTSTVAFTGDSIALGDFLPEVMGALCRAFARCSAYATGDCAFSAASVSSTQAAIVADVQAGKYTYNPAAAADYVKAYDALACGATDMSLDSAAIVDVFEGSVAANGACFDDFECAGDLFCYGNGACPGACTARLQLGATCDSSMHCAAGLVCSDSVCVEPIALGEDCVDGDACGFMATCTTDAVGADSCVLLGTTTYVRALGQTCSSDGASYCQQGLACKITDSSVSYEGVCVAKVGAGEVCSYAIPDMCSSGLHCDIADGATEGTCVVYPAEGEACGFMVGSSYVICQSGLNCLNDICIVPKADGATCAEDAECSSSHCHDGTCAVALDCESMFEGATTATTGA